MTPIKAEAIRMMEQVPDSLVLEWMVVMRDYINKKTMNTTTKSETKVKTSAVFNDFVSHCKKGTLADDYKEELAESLGRRYESIH